MRSTVLLILVLLTGAAAVLAQPGQQRPGGPPPGVNRPVPPDQPPAPRRDFGTAQDEGPRGTGVLRGTVVSIDGTPIRRAQVRISGPGAPGRVAATDAQGRFELRDLAAARYSITASKAGFVSLQYGQRRPSEPGTPIELADKQVMDKLVIALPRGSVISGRVSDEYGEPVANASVTAMRYGFASGMRRLIAAAGQNARDTTDDQGQFRLFGLPPGEYVVSASLRAGVEAADPAGETSGYAPTYFPGTSNVGEAQRVQVGLGQEQGGVTFALIATRLVRVTGAVINSQGGPVTAGTVQLALPASRNATTGQMYSGRIDGTGQFRIANVPPGRYVAVARTMPGRGPAQSLPEFGRLEIVVGAEDLHGVVLATGPGAIVRGQVATDTNVPPPFPAQQLQITARPADPDQMGPFGGPAANARVNADWSFEMRGLFDARLFRTNAPQGWSLKQVLLDGQDVTDTPMEFSTGPAVPSLQIVLTDKSTDVSGRLVDSRGAAVTDATVIVFPAEEDKRGYQSRFIRSTRPDQQGQFQLRGLPPNDRYLAIAIAGVEDGQASDPEFLASIEQQATSFTLADGEVKTIELRPRAR